MGYGRKNLGYVGANLQVSFPEEFAVHPYANALDRVLGTDEPAGDPRAGTVLVKPVEARPGACQTAATTQFGRTTHTGKSCNVLISSALPVLERANSRAPPYRWLSTPSHLALTANGMPAKAGIQDCPR